MDSLYYLSILGKYGILSTFELTLSSEMCVVVVVVICPFPSKVCLKFRWDEILRMVRSHNTRTQIKGKKEQRLW